jgi:guanylate kinase
MSEKKSNFVCLITGPMGSGKSSVSNALANRFERSAVIQVDTLRGMIKGGFVRPYPHNDEVDLQLSLVAKNACDMANNFLEKDFCVFIDGIVGKKLFEQYSNFFKDRNFKAFLLLPSLEALLVRFDNRGKYKEIRERTIELHKKFSERQDQLNWQAINSSDQSLEETVEQIYKEVI